MALLFPYGWSPANPVGALPECQPRDQTGIKARLPVLGGLVHGIKGHGES